MVIELLCFPNCTEPICQVLNRLDILRVDDISYSLRDKVLINGRTDPKSIEKLLIKEYPGAYELFHHYILSLLTLLSKQLTSREFIHNRKKDIAQFFQFF